MQLLFETFRLYINFPALLKQCFSPLNPRTKLYSKKCNNFVDYEQQKIHNSREVIAA